ncbi:MAG: hypothetical protein U9Q05_00445, partial [Thermodesulfobacteriota bacterium]|nr:hypothetical protein [Thermodesulfobacteriota bacterium]
LQRPPTSQFRGVIMGKNSLIKSTSKEKEKIKKDKETEAVPEEKAAAKPPQQPSTRTTPVEKTGKEVTKSTRKKDIKAPPVKKPATEKKAPPPKPEPPKAPEPPKTPEPPVTVTYETPSGPNASEPVDKTLLIAGGCILFLFLLIIGASASNSSRYYIKKMPMGIEIRQGKFAPLGEKKVIALPDINAPEEQKAVYSRDEAYPLIFKHYLNKADALLTAPGIPDYENIKTHLTQAQNFAVTNELAQAASQRLVAIDLHNLLYRAGVARDRDTIADLEKSLGYLSQTGRLELEPEQVERINRQRDTIRERLRELKEVEAAMEAVPE